MRPVWTREKVAERILEGDHLVIYRGQLLRVPVSWLAAHPGGALAILHFVGRDATDEIDAYHSDHTITTRLKKFAIGSVESAEHGWEPLVPPVMSGWVRKQAIDGTLEWHNEADAIRSTEANPLQISSEILLVPKDVDSEGRPTLSALLPPPSELSAKVQAEHSVAYKALHKRVVDAGLYQCHYLTGYGPEVARYIFLGVASAAFYRADWLITSAVFLGMLWHQLTFTAHDLGHMGVTHSWTIDRLLGIFVANFLGGLSIGWWVDNHNIHHLVPNHPSHDPDIEHLPFFAVSPLFLRSLWSTYYKRTFVFDRAAALFTSIQHHLFYIVMSLARFNLYRLSYTFMARKASEPAKAKGSRWGWWLELAGIIFFWCWFGVLLRGCGTIGRGLMYLLVSHIVTSPLHVQIVLSHYSRSTQDFGPTESFPARQLRTTTDVVCPPGLAFLHGGLDLQVTHHLFPRLPRHNLKRASALVKAFAAEQGLEYAEFGFVEGNAAVRSVLRDVAHQVSIVRDVARAEVHEAIQKKGL